MSHGWLPSVGSVTEKTTLMLYDAGVAGNAVTPTFSML
jgi:hypothetical protein